MKIYRVVVRGHFADLEESSRMRLLGEADDHHYLQSAFTADGTFTYDEQLVAFNFRYEVRVADDLSKSETEIGDAAIDRTAKRLDKATIGHRRLRATVTDMATMWD